MGEVTIPVGGDELDPSLKVDIDQFIGMTEHARIDLFSGKIRSVVLVAYDDYFVLRRNEVVAAWADFTPEFQWTGFKRG